MPCSARPEHETVDPAATHTNSGPSARREPTWVPTLSTSILPQSTDSDSGSREVHRQVPSPENRPQTIVSTTTRSEHARSSGTERHGPPRAHDTSPVVASAHRVLPPARMRSRLASGFANTSATLYVSCPRTPRQSTSLPDAAQMVSSPTAMNTRSRERRGAAAEHAMATASATAKMEPYRVTRPVPPLPRAPARRRSGSSARGRLVARAFQGECLCPLPRRVDPERARRDRLQNRRLGL